MDKRDPICGMEGRLAAHDEVFCSIHCLRAFEAKKSLVKTEPVNIAARRWRRFFTPAVYFACAVVLFGGFFIDPLHAAQASFWGYLRLIGPAFALGLLIASIVDVFIPKELISSALGRGGWSDVVKGSALGFAASSCSHGCLVIAVELYKKGASPAAFLSFLMASPWASLPTTVLLIRLFGQKGLLIVGLAFVISIVTGLAVAALWRRGLIEANPYGKVRTNKGPWTLLREEFHVNKKPAVLWPRLRDAFLSLTGMTLPWISLGILLSAVISAHFGHWIGGYMGRGATGPLAALVAASAIEICSEGSSPVAFEIYRQTAALGSAFVFLQAGVVTDFTEISLVAANAGKKTALAMVAVALPQTLLAGYLLNLL
ncbi:MAG: permease [Elusimicrobia bacterium]|nr:permease [Elusimicrobiota bacterium]